MGCGGGIGSALGTVAGGIIGGPAGAAIGGSLGGAIGGSMDKQETIGQAAGTQAGAAQAGITEQQRQFDSVVELMSPYVTAGEGALGQQQAIVGLQGPEAQQQAISGFEQSPLFQSLTDQGESAILQRASATGGLRGGNVQAALGQFRPQLLNQLIEQQYGRLGGLSQLGQASAAGQGLAGMQTGQNVSGLLAQQGAATAGGQLAQGAINQDMYGQLAKAGGTLIGSGGLDFFGGSSQPQVTSDPGGMGWGF